jgi:glyoxylase-like metal-dependent hydrolase (beta-lactamase superfamily II)
MRIHHLNTGTMCPVAATLVNGRGGLFTRGRLVCHVLLIERANGLALVDTGLGTADIATPDRLGKRWVRQAAPRLDPAETALAQVQVLGYRADDVRDILLTHLDLDHAGGLPDFPAATVHVHRREHAAAIAHTPAPRWTQRYIDGHWAHGPRWALHDDGGEPWFGFAGVRALGADEPDVLLIPLPGHTAGHSGIAVRGERGWLLHAGDAYFFHGQIASPPVRAPLGLRIFQRRADTDRVQRVANQARLAALHAAHADEITIFNGHDPFDYDRATRSAAA